MYLCIITETNLPFAGEEDEHFRVLVDVGPVPVQRRYLKAGMLGVFLRSDPDPGVFSRKLERDPSDNYFDFYIERKRLLGPN